MHAHASGMSVEGSAAVDGRVHLRSREGKKDERRGEKGRVEIKRDPERLENSREVGGS